jgi:hypothetical protein
VRKIFVLVITTLITATFSYAQTGKIAGKVLNEKNEPLSGVSIKIDESAAGGVATDVEGRFLIKLKPGKHSLTLTSVGYNNKTITDVQVDNNGLQELTIVMQAKSKELSAVVVSVSARRETDFALLNMQKNNASISDGISAETIKRSPDKNTGEVLKRVSGTSIQDNKFVVVRGLIDRYNVATINNAMLPSTEPDRRAFSFDIIPSSLIDNIMIYKTANPDLPGDFAGGVVQVSTKDVPSKNFLSLGVGASYNTISTGKDFNPGYLSPTDYLGFDDGSRKLPDNFPTKTRLQGSGVSWATRAEYSRLLKNTYGDRYKGNALPNQSYQLSWGKRFDLKNSAVIGSILALTYRNSQTLVEGVRSEFDNNSFPGTNGAAYTYNDSTYKFSTSIGALYNISYKKGNTKIAFKNLFNRLLESTNLLRSGPQYYNSFLSLNAQGGETVIKTLYSTQLEGDHSFKNKSKLTWNVNYALTLRDNPDYKFAPFAKDSSDLGKADVPYTVVLRDTYRFFANLEEHAVGGNVNYSRPLSLFGDKAGTIKVGLLSQYKYREFKARIFRYNSAPSGFNEAILTMPVKTIFQDANMNENGLALEEITNPTDKYDANSMLNAGYVMLDNRLNDKLRLVWGVRVENFRFRVNTFDLSGLPAKPDKSYLDILPSLNLTYSLNARSNLRFSASRTVSRPEFREVANFAFYDFVRNVQVTGNTKLERSQNTNVDLRYEIYPTNGEVISASVFVKHFNKPIEQFVDPGSNPLNMMFRYYNAKYAMNYGIEAEIKKRLSFLGKQEWLEDLFVFANAALIKSTVNVDGLDVAVADKDRPMQGQSPYVINAGLTYAGRGSTSASLLVNRIGQRIEAVGNDPVGIPDIYENGRTIIDIQLSQKVFRKKGEIKLNISDLLNQKSIFYQNYRTDLHKISDKRSYKSSEDRIWASYRYGSSIGLSFTYNL